MLLNALLQAPALAEAEGTALEATRGGRTLALLRSLLATWAADASARCAAALRSAWADCTRAATGCTQPAL